MPDANAFLNNPAGRLHRVFAQLASIEENVSMDEAWAKVFGIDDGNSVEMTEHLSEVASLLRDCITAAHSMSHFGNVHDLLVDLHYWGRTTFGIGADRQASQAVSNYLPPHAVATLSMLSTTLQAHVPEIGFGPSFTRAAFDQARLDIDTLIGEISEDDELPSELRTRIVRKLWEASTSFRFVEYRGVERLVRDLHEVNETLQPRKQLRSTQSESVMKKLDGFFERSLAIANKVYQMVAPLGAALYLTATKDPIGAALILSASPSHLEMAKQIAQAASNAPKLLTDGQNAE